MASLTGQTIAATYHGILKTIGDNVNIPTGSTGVRIVDGEETVTALYLTDGEVGIGTATPNEELDVNGDIGIIEGSTLGWHNGAGAFSGNMYFDSSDIFHLRNTSSETERFTILADGKVGIGTASPDYLCEISAESTDAILTITTYDDDAGDHSQLILRTADNTENSPALIEDNDILGLISFQGYTNAFKEGVAIVARAAATPASGNDMPADLEFWTTPDGSATALQRMTILEDGKVGIGIAAPTSALHVSVPSDWDTSAPAAHIVNNDVSGGHGNGLLIEAGAGADYVLHCTDLADNSRFYVNRGGNVGIGTAAPDTILHLESTSATIHTISCINSTESTSATIDFKKADASTNLVDDNAVLGQISFAGMDADSGGTYINGALIRAQVNGTPTDDQMPCDLEFHTNTGGASFTLNAYVHEGGDFYTNDGSVSSISSDERLKKDIRDFTHGLSIVNQLNPVYYKFNGKGGRNEDVEDRIGMLANVVKDIAPDITKSNMGDLDGVETELWTMTYDKLIFYVVNAVQELSAKVTALENA